MVVVICAGLILILILLLPKEEKQVKNYGIATEETAYEQGYVNPYMGFAPPAEGGPYSQPHSLVYANLTWKELEPEKGQYDFKQIEEKYKFHEWKEKKVKFIFRIVLDYPNEAGEKDIPDWLYQEINQDGTWYDDEYGKGFSPNYANKKLISYHEKLIQAFGDRYNQDNGIAFIELGSIGHYGEWHTLQQQDTYISFPKLPVTDLYVSHYVENFADKILLMRRPYQIAKEEKMGLYNDMFGNKKHTVEEFWQWVENGYQFWLTKEQHPAMPGYWKVAPTGGELAPEEDWGTYFSSERIEEVIKQLELTHVSWLGPNSPSNYPANGEFQKNINLLLNKMGYHFRLLSETHPETARQGSDFEIGMEWENTGVAPFYYPWPLELSLKNKQGEIVHKQVLKEDIRRWLPGEIAFKETIQLSADLEPGDYDLNIAILDPEEMEPGIRFNMKGEQADGRYQIGKITVE